MLTQNEEIEIRKRKEETFDHSYQEREKEDDVYTILWLNQVFDDIRVLLSEVHNH